MINEEKQCLDFAGRIPPDCINEDVTHWPGQIALDASLFLGQMERGMLITSDSLDCVDIAIGKLERAKEIIGART